MSSETDPASKAPPRGAAHRSWEALVFAGATGVGMLHAVDDAFLHRQPGVGLGQHALAGAVSIALGATAIAAFPRMRPVLRAATALLLGSLAFINGLMHVKHVQDLGASGSDVTGVLAAGAGVVLVVLAAAVLVVHRGEGAVSRRRRWAYRVLAVPLGLLALLYTVIPMNTAITEAHKFREAIGAPPSPDYQEVEFEATDGVDISGWYRPTRNGATMLVVHGGGGDRTGVVAQAKMLVRHGYGVLLHDARGRGRSEGAQNSFGWGWTKDLAGALAFLKARPEVDPQRIGGFGSSTGADVLIEVAGKGKALRAVVSDGGAAASFEDWHRLQGLSPLTPFLLAEYATVGVTSGATPGPAMEDMVKRISSPLLLVSAGRDAEYNANVSYDRAAGSGPVEHWNMPDATHTAGIRQDGPAYERRVMAFVDAAMLGR